MNDNLKNFVDNLGLLCETWSITYTKFIQMGYEHKAAIEHTKEFMTAFMASALQHNGGKNE